jgi:murein DD-endopeptidase MepM/ murein hydrolase activator NlpD
MRVGTSDTSLSWEVREAVVPFVGLVAILWLASFELSVIPFWAPGSAPAAPSSRSVQPSAQAPDVSLVLPVEGASAADLIDTFTDPRSGGRTHHAIDIMAPHGSRVVAAAGGTVIRRGNGGLGGKSVTIASPDSSFAYYYAHLSDFTSQAAPGTHVEAGDAIGYVGSTGNAGTAHLHFAIWAVDDLRGPLSRHPVNPYPLLR